jgi:hypothetical protein
LARLPWAPGGKGGGFRPIEEVPAYEEVDVETAGDDDVCIICEGIAEDGPYELDEAEGLIPAHPWCRCAFVPAGKGSIHEFDSDQTDARPETLYVSRPVLNAAEIIAFFKAQGLDAALTPDDMHVTIAFSREPVDWSQFEPEREQIEAVGGQRKMARLGDDGDALVLKFDSAELSRRHWQFRAGGASWDWPSYEPHVTLSWQASEGLDFRPWAGVIQFGPEQFAPVKEDWKESVRHDAQDEEAGHPFRGNQYTTGESGGAAPAREEEQPAFHGTTREIRRFSELGDPEEGNDKYGHPDRMIGYHFAKDPAVSNAFVMERINEEERGAKSGGRIIPVNIPADKHLLEVPQPQFEWAAKEGQARTSRNIETDELAIDKMIAREAYPSHPEILAKFLESRTMKPDEAQAAAKLLTEGGTVHLPVDGAHDLDWLIRNFHGAFPLDAGAKRELVRTAREHWQKRGYKGLKYINTSPMETMATAGVKDPTSFVVFNPKHVRGRYTGDQVGFKFTFTTDAIWWDDEPGHPFRGNQYVRVQSALKPEAQRAFEGEQVPSKTKLTKLQKDEVGEQIMFRLMEKLGLKNPQSLNEHYGVNNYPLDLAGDHLAIELKTGDASNGPSGQQWNTKIGQMGPAEQAKYDKMSPEKRRAHNDKKMKDIIKRKYQALARLRRETGVDYKPWTFGVILDTDRKVADIHAVPGYHPRIGYKQKEAQDGYVTTVRYK